jgi:hypothetical protein
MSQGHEVSSEVEREQDPAPTESPKTTVCDSASSHVQRSKGKMIHERSFRVYRPEADFKELLR